MKKAATFTCSIDDGHPSDLKTASLLAKHGLNASFYIPIRNREGMSVMSPSQIRELGQRFEIGSHTYDHCFLNRVNFPLARFQVMIGKESLEEILGQKVAGFCYPGGKYGSEHVHLVEAAGFEYARTTLNLCFDAGQSRYEMPTTCQFYPHPRSVYLRNFASGRNWRKRCAGLTLALTRKHWIDRLHHLFEYACDRGAVFHLWGHSSDIEALNAWKELDAFLKHVASSIGMQERLTNAQLASRAYAPATASALGAATYR